MRDIITIIIPVYNVEKYIEKCLQSILIQNFNKLEIIILDDGSNDQSIAIAQSYQRKYQGMIRIISQENKGQGGARNTGIKNAEGKYLLFVDGDDAIKPDMLQKLYNYMEKSNADIIFFGTEYVDENGAIICQRTEFPDRYMEFTLSEQPYLFAKDGYIWDKIYKTELFLENNIWFPEQMWYEDLNVEAKILLCAKKMVSINEIFYEYLQRNGSTMHNCNVEKNRDMLYSIQDILEYYKSKSMYEKYYEQLEFLVAFHIMTLCTLRVAGNNPQHPLLNDFFEFAHSCFPEIQEAKKELSFKYKIVFYFSNRKQYRVLWIMSKIKNILKKKVQ